ncbi:Alpha-1,2-mannosyltransferase [Wickerhamomyces ciferrii]|uniref:Alpha-1,2-mannosyltransferase n=1 Tax=Wickerhamomyces ciferrii (strain ATCC 14091 / BCRC 22168 / CBS 111 / JCM 3599 / NBRC 0793 / NRRL Y-1031 F-60-10) TaxID=1206466 RepID=K0KI58_WICCF|nr:Alpha-1,2-mannosyltransferase [Wickerhamomyces ciferrii]CCH42696.1 Alpha-1,2-mannosyltransferase [Wickerhamomyces ciferrii]
MNALLYKSKRIFKKKGSLILLFFIILVFIFNYSSLSKYTSDQLSNYSQSSSNLGTDDDDNTIPFYKSNAAKPKTQIKEENEKKSRLEKMKLIQQDLDEDKSGSRLVLGHTLFNKVFEILKKGEPKIPKLERYKSDDRIYHAGYDGDSNVVFSEDYLSSFLQLTDDEVSSLQKSHKLVVDNLPEQIPKTLYKGNGIVYVGGGKFNWLALLSIKSLRSLGSKLPIEVVIPTMEEYEIDLCGRIFPALNAKCILLEHSLGDAAMSKFKFKGYQYKALALIVSSFENVLLVDADNIPVHAPDYLFENEPFINTGLITWPDFWRRATSPDYYKIAGIKINDKRVRFGYDDRDKDSKEVPLHDREGAIPDPTSESGQLMISKTSHTKELFLALYYNLYGPDYYYPLFSQGSDGEGDKETFLAATVALDSSYYQVKKFLNAFGHFNMDHEFIGTGMGQYDPVEDYNLERAKARQKEQSKELNQDLEPITKQPRILFVHANFPKLNPISLRDEKKIFEKNGDRLRLYGPGMAKRVGYDFELVQWRNMHFLICELKVEVEVFKGNDNVEVCKEILDQLEHLEATVKDNERD